MKVPAIRAKIGIWVYYVATLTFGQVADSVRRVDDELHKSPVLREMLQRSITSNYKSISRYIEQQEERFFNALVLAVYDGDPQWHEVRLDYGDGEEFYDIGLLELTGEEKIFPVDGQHRVEGIKDAIKVNPDKTAEKIPVIFIGHKKDADGMQRARRLFSTLNRYAKPVSMRDIIALDEDDSIAIVSRELIDNHKLFSDKRILDSKSKAIPESNTTAFTSIITFYECNRELISFLIKNIEIKNSEGKKLRGSPKLQQFIRFRPEQSLIEEFTYECFSYWTAFATEISPIKEYINTLPTSAEKYRNRDGGCILFRPIALLPFVKASMRIKEKYGFDNNTLLNQMSKLPLNLSDRIWRNVLWNSTTKTMVTSYQSIVEFLLIFLFDRTMLTNKDTDKLLTWLDSIYQIGRDEVESLIEGYFVKQRG